MNDYHENAIKGQITGENNIPHGFNIEPYSLFPNLPKLSQKFIDDCLARQASDYSFLPTGRLNRTPVIDQDCLFNDSHFMNEARKYFEFMGATILKFDPMTVLDWHKDPRQCGLNFLLNEHNNSHTFMRENREGWNYYMTELHYDIGVPILLNTHVEHSTYNFDPNKTRYVLTISFGRNTTYQMAKEYLQSLIISEY
jgi:hypothetical protein